MNESLSQHQLIGIMLHLGMGISFLAFCFGKVSSWGTRAAYIVIVIANLFGLLQIIVPAMRVGEPVMYGILLVLFLVSMVWAIQIMTPGMFRRKVENPYVDEDLYEDPQEPDTRFRSR